MHEPRGLPRLRALFERWVRRVTVEIDSGCIYISGAVEFDDRPGPGARRAGDDGPDLAHGAGARDPQRGRRRATCGPTPTPQQMLFEIHGLILALHHDARFLRNPGAVERARAGFEHILAHYATGDAGTQRAPAARR